MIHYLSLFSSKFGFLVNHIHRPAQTLTRIRIAHGSKRYTLIDDLMYQFHITLFSELDFLLSYTRAL